MTDAPGWPEEDDGAIKRSELRKRRRRQGPLPYGRPKVMRACPRECGYVGSGREMRAHMPLCPRKSRLDGLEGKP